MIFYAEWFLTFAPGCDGTIRISCEQVSIGCKVHARDINWNRIVLEGENKMRVRGHVPLDRIEV